MMKNMTLATLSAGLIASAAHCEPTGRPSNDVRIELSSFAIKPETVKLQSGRTYVITFVNTSRHSHDFTAVDFFDAVTLSQNDRIKVINGRVKLSGGQEVRLTLSPSKTGTYEFHCSHLLHSSLGMTGSVRVL